MTPERIGKFKILGLLGRGAMGEVFLGQDPYIGRQVAIKLVKDADPAARERLMQEARVIGRFSHPRIVLLLEFDFSGDEPYLAMEYLPGASLEAWAKQTRSLDERLVIAEDLLSALEYAHGQGVLHRDVKPGNVQVLPDGRAKLMDFGIARAQATKLTATGQVMGTPNYMAPEILQDAHYSERSDLYSAAVVIYEMLAGSNPFAGKTVASTLTNVLALDPPSLRDLRPEVPAGLADAVMACLRKDPARRPEIATLLKAVHAARAAGSPAAEIAPSVDHRSLETQDIRVIPPPAAAAPVSSPARASHSGWIAAGAVLALGVTAWVATREPTREAPLSELQPSRPPPPTAISSSPLAKPSEEAAPASASPATARKTPLARPARETGESPTPATLAPREPATPAPSPPQSESSPTLAPTATPAPLTAGPTAPPSATVPVAAAPTLTGVSPRSGRRGSTLTLQLHGADLRGDLVPVALQGRRPAAGLRVLKREFVNPGLIKVTLLIDEDTPLGTYTIALRDPAGELTNGVGIEVVL